MDDLDGYERVGRAAEVPEGGLVAVRTAAGAPICLYRWAGRVGALSDVCTHQEFEIAQGTLLPDGGVECAWHGAIFDCRTGAVRQGPAVDPLPVYAVREREGDVYVRLASP